MATYSQQGQQDAYRHLAADSAALKEQLAQLAVVWSKRPRPKEPRP